jgi:hypothetical protein
MSSTKGQNVWFIEMFVHGAKHHGLGRNRCVDDCVVFGILQYDGRTFGWFHNFTDGFQESNMLPDVAIAKRVDALHAWISQHSLNFFEQIG